MSDTIERVAKAIQKECGLPAMTDGYRGGEDYYAMARAAIEAYESEAKAEVERLTDIEQRFNELTKNWYAQQQVFMKGQDRLEEAEAENERLHEALEGIGREPSVKGPDGYYPPEYEAYELRKWARAARKGGR